MCTYDIGLGTRHYGGGDSCLSFFRGSYMRAKPRSWYCSSDTDGQLSLAFCPETLPNDSVSCDLSATAALLVQRRLFKSKTFSYTDFM